MIRKFSTRALHHAELQSARTGEKFSLSAVLTDELGLKDLFIHHDIIPPGRRTSGTHFHTHREEMVFVLEGRVTAWCDGAEVTLEPGDFVAFPPGERGAHHLKNESDAPARVLVIASNPSEDQVEYR
ncbi:MAG TPA: cupin domain-containing protein [Candidatus Nanopelagicales bacterium]|nr:cupin domain-containing protein [Candidatus Nanopelagicales bacterium]